MDDYMYWTYLAGFEDDDKMEVELGSIYQINHSKLTPRTPLPLRSIRLVMVSEKTEWNVSVRYPSIESLKRYFHNKSNEIYPEMDQRFVMDRKLAERVLFGRVPSEEFLVKKDMEEFWLVMSNSGSNENSVDVISKKAGFCLSELKSSGVPRWGVRRQVKFIGKHRERNNSLSSSSIVERKVKKSVVSDEEVEEEEDEKEDDEEEKEEEEEEKEEEKEEEEEEEEKEREEEGEEEEEVADLKEKIIETYDRPKRKCCEVNLKANQKQTKKVKLEKNIKNKKKQKKSKKRSRNKCMEIVLAKTPMSTRWSEERYKQAQEFLFEVMKSKGAVANNPILRPNLREEARKKIGDTGLLDHLLKHVAGMVAPGGAERFRRRHNADGAMEYWLESAHLVALRREIGVEDPFWTPPPGWKLGDCPTQDPICAQEIKELKEEVSILKRDMKDMISRKQMENELSKIRREMEKLIAKNQKKESQAIMVSDPGQISDRETSLFKMETYYKEQLTMLSDNFIRIEGEMVNLKSKVDDSLSKREEEPKTSLNGGATIAAKAAKIERLKSGFRICKPQGTFLWPNNNNNNASNVVVQVEDMTTVPTPPSVSSSRAFLPPPLLSSPVKPTPEKRAITVSVSSVGNSNFSSTTATTTNGNSNKTTTWINLNDAPPVTVTKGEPRQSSSGSCSKKEVGTWLALASPTDNSVDGPTRG